MFALLKPMAGQLTKLAANLPAKLPSKLRPVSTCCSICGQWQNEIVCSACLRAFAPARLRCHRCGLPADDEHASGAVAQGSSWLCSSCESYPPEMDQVVVAVDFTLPWSGLISQLKFRDTPAAVHTLCEVLSQAVAREQKEAPDLIVPIPLSAQRWKERAYNQAWLLARGVAMRQPWQNRLSHDTLLRRHETGRLMGMQADERVRRIRDAFHIPPDRLHRVEGQHVVLVDDVMTTGATANEAARTLLHAGAASVTGWFAARTPKPSRSEH